MACVINYNKDEMISRDDQTFCHDKDQALLISLMELEAHCEVDYDDHCINDEKLTSLIRSLEAEIITRPHHHHHHDNSQLLSCINHQVSAVEVDGGDHDHHMDFCLDHIDHDHDHMRGNCDYNSSPSNDDHMIMMNSSTCWYEDGDDHDHLMDYNLGTVNYNLEYSVSNLEDMMGDGYLWQLQEPYSCDVSVYAS